MIERIEGRNEGLSLLGKGVFNCWRYRAVLFTADQSVAFQFAQALGISIKYKLYDDSGNDDISCELEIRVMTTEN